MKTCGFCDAPNSDGARFCDQCGEPFPGHRSSRGQDVEERRHCTVLFCDLVESTSLSEELGPEGYKEVTDVVYGLCGSIIKRYGGEVSLLTGDGVMALFGHRLGHEDDAARAVHAALDIQTAIRGCGADIKKRVPDFARVLRSRAAVHTGLVLIGYVRESEGRRITAFGDTVSIAFRLQDQAAPDSMLISAATQQLIGQRFVTASVGRKAIRGIRDPLEVFRVVGIGPTVGRHDAARRGAASPLVGRDDEIRILRDKWASVVEGRGQIVVLTGDAGVGKSRLLGELKQDLQLGDRWLEMYGSEYLEASELRPVLEFLERRVLRGSTGFEGRHQLERAMTDAGLDPGESPQILASLLSLPPLPDDTPLTLLPDQRRRRALEALVAWFLNMAAGEPIVIAFEDLQWADPTTIDLLSRLSAVVSKHRVLLLVTCRAPFAPPWTPESVELRHVIRPLTPAAARVLVTVIAGCDALPDHVMREVLEKSDHVPLFLEEVTRMLAQSAGAVESIPRTLRELLSARLDGLPVSTRDVIRVGSVIGRRFSRELLLSVSEKQPAAVDEAIDILLDAAIFLTEGDGYSFKHVLLRDEAYDHIPRAARVPLHGKVAATLQERFPHVADSQPELVAHHLTEAEAFEAALREWRRAGARSFNNAAYSESGSHYERALSLCGRLAVSTDAERSATALVELELRKDFGLSLIATKGYAFKAVEDNYERALQVRSSLSKEGGDVPIPILYGLWGTYFMRGDPEATDQLAKDFERVRESPDPLARHVAHSVLGARAFYRGEFGYATEQFEQGIRLYNPEHHFVLTRDYGYAGGLYSHSYLACVYCFAGYPDRGLALANEAVGITRSLNDPYAQAMALGFACCVARERGEVTRAKLLSGDLAELAGRHEFVLWLHIALCLQGWSRLSEGDAGSASDQIRSGLDMYEATGARLPGQYLRLILIESDLARGDVQAGLANVELGLQRCRETFDCYLEPEYRRVKGELLELRGAVHEAEGEIRNALDGARKQGATWMELRSALSLSKLCRRYGRPADAPQILAHVVARLTEGTETREFQEAQALLAYHN